MLQDFTYSFQKIVQIRVCVVYEALNHLFGVQCPDEPRVAPSLEEPGKEAPARKTDDAGPP